MRILCLNGICLWALIPYGVIRRVSAALAGTLLAFFRSSSLLPKSTSSKPGLGHHFFSSLHTGTINYNLLTNALLTAATSSVLDLALNTYTLYELRFVSILLADHFLFLLNSPCLLEKPKNMISLKQLAQNHTRFYSNIDTR